MLAASPFPGTGPHIPLWRTARRRPGHMRCVRACVWAGVPPGAGAQVSFAATCHRPVPGARRPRGGRSVQDGLVVICWARQAAASAPQATARPSRAEASRLFLEPSPSLDTGSPAEISRGQTSPFLGIFWKRETEGSSRCGPRRSHLRRLGWTGGLRGEDPSGHAWDSAGPSTAPPHALLTPHPGSCQMAPLDVHSPFLVSGLCMSPPLSLMLRLPGAV